MPSAADLLPLARALDVTIEELLTGQRTEESGGPTLLLGENEVETIRDSSGATVHIRVSDARYEPILPESTSLLVSTKSTRSVAGIHVLEQRADDAAWSRQLLVVTAGGRKSTLLSLTEPFRPIQAGDEAKLFRVLEIRVPT